MKIKDKHQRRSGTVCIFGFLLFMTSIAPGQLVPQSSLNLNLAGSTGPTVTITNAGDQVWVIQASSDLVDWTEVEVWKVHNGSFRGTAEIDPSVPGQFFRAVYDPSRQTIPSTVENALLLPTPDANYSSPILPPNFLVPPIVNQDDTPATNVVTDATATLGRVLFYDKRLSTNQTISCSSCHQREHGFADSRRFSTGFNGGSTARNAMGLTNARWYLRRHFFWDERANTLEDQVLMPIQNSVEMGMTLDALVSRLSAEPFYTNLFYNAFGSPDVTSTRISLALARSFDPSFPRGAGMTKVFRSVLAISRPRKISVDNSSSARWAWPPAPPVMARTISFRVQRSTTMVSNIHMWTRDSAESQELQPTTANSRCRHCET
jgi:hypothetical protein